MDNPALDVEGLTWADIEHPKREVDLEEAVEAAQAAHERRLGCPPNLVLVHPDRLGEPTRINGVVVAPQKGILHRHYHAVRIPEGRLPQVDDADVCAQT